MPVEVVREQVELGLRDAEDAPGLLAGRQRPRALAGGRVLRRALVPLGAVEGDVLRQLLDRRRSVTHTQPPRGACARAPSRISIVRSSPAAGPPGRGPRRGPATRRRPGDRRPASDGRKSAAPGRPPAAASSVDRDARRDLDRRRVPALRLAGATRSARRCANRSSGNPNQAAFQASAQRAASRSTRSPLAATRIGMRPGIRAGRGGGGMRTASSTSCQRPVEGHPLATEQRDDDLEGLLEPARRGGRTGSRTPGTRARASPCRAPG